MISVKNIYKNFEKTQVLKGVSCEINKGDFVAVTGISGIGKSTLFKLMMGVLTPQNGEITLCGKGYNISAGSETRKLFSYVPQGNLLFSGTLYENITFMSEGKTKEEIDEAIRLSCCDEFINEFEENQSKLIIVMGNKEKCLERTDNLGDAYRYFEQLALEGEYRCEIYDKFYAYIKNEEK